MIGDDNFMDEIDCGNFFDTIDDLIDFPVDDSLPALPYGPNFTTDTNTTACSDPLPSIWSTQTESLKVSDTVFSDNSNSPPDLDLPADLSVPFGDDPVPLDWLSNFLADPSDGGSLTMNLEESILLDNKDSSRRQFHTSSPVSVLESSSSCSGEKTTATAPRSPEVITSGKCGRARSKRPRPATFTPRPGMQLISHCSSVTQTDTPRPVLAPKVPSDTENFAESRLIIKLPKHVVGAEHKKRKKIKLTVPPPTVGESQNSPLQQQQPVRKCMHCEITKTPQWRAGPMGPKTLCNACGVRYKSGRLFPEYRPAASPTFVPSLHSNSHKKVLEMRTKTGAAGTAAVTNNSSEMIPINKNLALEYMRQDYEV